jgi:pimeloyl-ACP methyl ester carboxylesterase
MRAREPDADGFVDRDGVKLHYEVFGDGEPTLLLLPTWTVVHSRFWKAQVPYLARHFRVVTYDGPGNGRSDRPEDPGPCGYEEQGRAAAAVLEATGTDRAVVVSLSMASQCFTEAHSTKQVEDSVGWGLETSPEVLLAEAAAPEPGEETLRDWCAGVRRPVLVVHGDRVEISPQRCGAALAEATGGSMVVLEGAGHIPMARDPVKVNLLIREFAGSLAARGRP